MKTFDHYCEYRKTPNGVVLAPLQVQKWLVLFCDEINLPDEDKFGTYTLVSSFRLIRAHFFITARFLYISASTVYLILAVQIYLHVSLDRLID